MYDGIMAETISLAGHGGDQIEAYLARPLGPGPFGSVVVIHHMPGYDVQTKEITRTFAANGYTAVCPNLYSREAPGASPDDAAATVRAAGGVPDERLVGDVGGAAAFLRAMPNSNGKVGVIGYCSGGRQSFLAACSLPLDAAVDCYGAFVVGTAAGGHAAQGRPDRGPGPQPVLPAARPVRRRGPVPVPGPGGRAGQGAGRRRASRTSSTATPGAGHAFFSVNRPAYRPEAANDGWQKIWDFYGRYLAS